jgi:hypothetical protein
VGVIDCSCVVTARILSGAVFWEVSALELIRPQPSTLTVNANNPVKGMYHSTGPTYRLPKFCVLEYNASNLVDSPATSGQF